MADAIVTVRTNRFRVTNEEQYQKLIKNLVCNDYITHGNKTDDKGCQLHSLGSYGMISYIPYPSQALEAGVPYYDEKGNEIPVELLDDYVEVYDGNGDYVYCRSEEEVELDYFIEALQAILPDGESLVWIEVGHEGLSDVWSTIGVITNSDSKWQYSGNYIADKVQEMTGNDKIVWY